MIRPAPSHRNTVIEAGAGSGKTAILVDQIVAVVSSGRANLSQVAAITFTESAALELRERVRIALEQSNDAALHQVAGELDDAHIGTIHGLARRVVQEQAAFLRLPSDVTVVDPASARSRLKQLIRTELGGLHRYASPGDLACAFALGFRISQLEALVEQMHDSWHRVTVAPSELVPVDSPALSVDDVITELERAGGLSGACLVENDRLLRHLQHDVAPFVSALRRASGDEVNIMRTLAEGPVLKVSGAGAKNAWESNAIDEVRRRLANAVKLIDDLLVAPRQRALGTVLSIAQQITTRAVATRRESGELEHHDTLVLAVEALQVPAIQAHYHHQWPFLFVDEVQDVDPLQVQLVQSIGKPGGRDAHQVTLVGDLRQSIYRFRGADAEAVTQLREWADAVTVALPTNHRSAPRLVSWVDTLFARWDEQWRASVPSRDDIDGSIVIVGGGTKQTSDEARAKTCEDLLGWINGELASGTALRDLAILMPGRRSLPSVERALQSALVPYRVEAQSLLWETDEVREVLAIVSALAQPDDPIATVAALRTAMLGCGDDDLARWVAAGNMFVGVGHGDDGSVVASGLRLLDEWRASAELLTPDEVVADVIARCEAFERAAANHRRREAWSRLRFLQRRARAWACEFDDDLAQFVAWTDEQRSERIAAHDQALPDPDDDAVRVMTVHAAKGLEFSGVAVVGLEAARAAPPSARLLWGGNRPMLRLGPADAGWHSSGFEQAAAADDEAARSEMRRLAYVACTRARDSLFVSLHHRKSSDCLARVIREALPEFVDDSTPAASSAASASMLVGLAHGDTGRPTPVPFVARNGDVPVVGASRLAAMLADQAAGSDVWIGDEALFGIAFHNVCETMPLQNLTLLGDYAQQELARFGLEHLQGDLIRAVHQLVAVPRVAAAVARERYWREVAQSAPLEQIVLRGRADLILDDDIGLHVIEYKTELLEPTPPEFDRRHRLQAAAYAELLAIATNRAVSASLVYVGGPVGREVALTDLDALRKDITRYAASYCFDHATNGAF